MRLIGHKSRKWRILLLIVSAIGLFCLLPRHISRIHLLEKEESLLIVKRDSHSMKGNDAPQGEEDDEDEEIFADPLPEPPPRPPREPELTSIMQRLENYYKTRAQPSYYRSSMQKGTQSAAFVILCRNSDVYDMMNTMLQLEALFNKDHRYPYVFLNNEEFSDEFKEKIKSVTTSEVEFGRTLDGTWGYPSWINQTYAAECRKDMKDRKILYGGSETYRNMCRFYSGFFFRHPLVAKYEYYWRVEPGVKFFCTISPDPFEYMKVLSKSYGYVVHIREFMDTIPTLWKHTRDWLELHDFTYHPLLNFFVGSEDKYKGCHFWSNFEIARTDLFNNPVYLDYFNYLDQSGGFFYERWGDAPVHSLWVAMALKKDQVHFFEGIGYYHLPYSQCPKTGPHAHKCVCPLNGNVGDLEWGSCLKPFLSYKETPYALSRTGQ